MLVNKTELPFMKTTLYFCPNCKKGHQVYKGMQKCDICGIDLEWEEKEPKEEVKNDRR